MKTKRLDVTKITIAVFAVLLTCALTLGICGLNGGTDNTASAAVSVWSGTTDTRFEGSGTKGNPYLITSAAELAGFAEIVNGTVTAPLSNINVEGKYIKLTTDIDLNNRKWTPIGTEPLSGSIKPFEGNFDGDGHTISNVKIEPQNPNNVGLFGLINGATIANVGIESGSITITSSGSPVYLKVGGIVGKSNSSASTITNCYNKASIAVTHNNTKPASTANIKMGGIVGDGNNSCSVINCYNLGSLSASSNATNQTMKIGGIAGVGGTITQNCYNSGTITSSDSTGSAGIASTGNVTDCYWLEGISQGSGVATNCDSFTAEAKTVQYGGTGDEIALHAALNNGAVAYNNGNPAAMQAKPWAADDTSNPVNGGYPLYVSNWIQLAATTFAGGTGTVNVPYQIATAEQLALLAKIINDGADATVISGGTEQAYADLQKAHYKLTADIDLGGFEWTPIGTDWDTPFWGVFDGNDYKIKNLTINDTLRSYNGLFGFVEGVENGGIIKNVGIESGRIVIDIDSKDSYVGGIVGFAGFTRVRVEEEYEWKEVEYFPQLINCYNKADISVDYSGVYESGRTTSDSIGGCAGTFYGNVINCYNTGNIDVMHETKGNAYAGGIVGSYGSVVNSYNTGNITVTQNENHNTYTGGIIGYYGSATNCYNVGSVTATGNGGTQLYAGGIAGITYELNNCYWLDSSATFAIGSGSTPDGCDSFTAATDTVLYNGAGNEVSLVTALNNGKTAYNTANADEITAGRNFAAKSWIADDATKPSNNGYPVFMPTATFTGSWRKSVNLPSGLAYTAVTGIKFLDTAPAGYNDSGIDLNGIKIYVGNGTDALTSDLAYVFNGKIMLEENGSGLFGGCEVLTSVDFTNFDTSYVTNMSDMFYICRVLPSIDLSGFDTSNVTDMSNMFNGCNSLTSLDLSSFDTSLITATSAGGNPGTKDMLNACHALATIKAPYGLDTTVSIDLPYNFVRASDTTNTPVNIITSSTCSTVGTAQTFNRQYAITYFDQGATDSITYTGSACDANYIYKTGYSLPTPTKDGYDFEGWFTTYSGTEPANNISTTDSGDKTFYAKWRLLHTHGTGDSAIVFDNELSAFTATLGVANTTKNYVLMAGFAATDRITIYGTVNLCLNGFTLDADSNNIYIDSGATLNVYDCSDLSAGKIKGTNIVVYVKANGSEFNLYDGTIEVTENQNAIYVNENSDVHIYGGVVTTNSSASTINGKKSSTINVDGGKVESLYDSTSAAAINANGNVNVNSGSVECAKGTGILFSSTNGTLSISGGTVSSQSGKAIYNIDNGSVAISGGTISATTGIAIRNEGTGTVNITGGTVSATTGNAIRNVSTGKITIGQATGATTTITSANADKSQGTVYLNAGTANETILEITGGTVENTAASGYARAVNNNGKGNIVISGGEVKINYPGAYVTETEKHYVIIKDIAQTIRLEKTILIGYN